VAINLGRRTRRAGRRLHIQSAECIPQLRYNPEKTLGKTEKQKARIEAETVLRKDYTEASAKARGKTAEQEANRTLKKPYENPTLKQISRARESTRQKPQKPSKTLH